jgi:hypothetical protein
MVRVRHQDRGPWYESDDPGRVVRGGLSRGVLYTLVILAVCAIVGIGVWVFRVTTSDVKGRGDATVIKNEARNRIRAQEGFEKVYADIVASDRKIDVADRAAKADPQDRTLRQNAAGVRQYCLTVVGDYNARARSFSQEDFRAADLPYRIDDTDPKTDCRGSAEK